LLDFLNRLFLIEAIEEKINIRSRSEFVVVIVAKCPL
jgi:hypothetical protein